MIKSTTVATKVFVPSRGNFDYTPAEEFGEVIFIAEGKVNKWDVNLLSTITKLAMEHSTAEDYIVITGLDPIIAIACALQGSKFGKLNVLLYDARFEKYNAFTVRL